MTTLEELHHEAMERADQADAARVQGKTDEARTLFAQAFALEAQALAEAPADLQPTQAVLLRSAACLAIDAEQFDDALRLIEAGLTNPQTPVALSEELDELFTSLLGDLPSVSPTWAPFEAPVDRAVHPGARLAPRELREVA